MKLDAEHKQKINYLFKVLEENKIRDLTVGFYGSGDSGNMEIEAPSCLNLKEPTIFDRGISDGSLADLDQLILEISDYILDKKDIDYANDYGNSGNIVYITEGKQITMAYLVTKDAEYTFNVK